MRLEPPSVRCVELCYEELIKISNSCGNKELQRYPKLHAKTIEVVNSLLRERLGPTVQYVESLIAIQRAYINTNHPDFVGMLSENKTELPSAPPLPTRPKTKNEEINGFEDPIRNNSEITAAAAIGSAINQAGQLHGDNFMDYFFGAVSKPGASAITMADQRNTASLGSFPYEVTYYSKK